MVRQLQGVHYRLGDVGGRQRLHIGIQGIRCSLIAAEPVVGSMSTFR